MAASIDDSIQFISVGGDSPGGQLPQPRTNTIHRTIPTRSSPPSSNDMAKFGAGYAASGSPSPSTSRRQDILQSPSWRRGEGFVLQSAGVDDPFVSSREAIQDPNGG